MATTYLFKNSIGRDEDAGANHVTHTDTDRLEEGDLTLQNHGLLHRYLGNRHLLGFVSESKDACSGRYTK